MPITELIVLFTAYLLGSISSAVIVCQIMGLKDPRVTGSNNPGATNVLRIGGRTAAALTFVGDILKGIIPVLIAIYFHFSLMWVGAIVIAAFLGHCLPIFFAFKGGKGVATVLGAVTTMNWQMGLILLIIWAVVFLIFRISSLAGISTAVALPGTAWMLSPGSFMPMLVVALLMIWRHQENIKKMLSGKENRFKKPD